MSTEEEGGGMDDVERSLEAADQEKTTIMDRIVDLKDSYVDFHTVDEEDKEEDFEETGFFGKPAAGDLSRRGFISLAGQTVVGGYAAVEALDGDGYAVDWESGGAGPVAGETEPTNGEPAAGIGTVGDVSDELYLQEDGDVIAIDHGHKEWRAFRSEDFQKNEAYQDLYNQLSESRAASDLPAPGLTEGIEVTQEELFDHSSAAYDDMADEAEWDLIFDSNPSYSGGA